ncbi:MAG TPA: TauD/TfdA family dioxygenase [Thermoanaerobaculia bacterium]|nr:TauD/TfdA family dioxygenase [Thermoanaerobaculia bacterium]
MTQPAKGGRFERAQWSSLAPQALSAEGADLVRESGLGDGGSLPTVFSPAVADVDLADWVAGNRGLLAQRLGQFGAILFRGFGIDSAPAFEAVARNLCGELFAENGEHPREAVTGSVYTPVFYPAGKRLLWHNENSFNHEWPLKILFCCLRPADSGGETPLVDSRGVCRRLDPSIRERFQRLGVRYVRNYGAGPGLDWQTVFRTADRAEVEARCAAQGLAVEWKAADRLRTSCVRPAVVRHPQTGEESWFNQAQHWHVSCLEPEMRSSLAAAFAEEDLPRHCWFGDGSPIPDAMMAEILAVYAELEVCFPWRAGDVVMLDNLLAAHGRNPFQGERKILVALGEMRTYDDV